MSKKEPDITKGPLSHQDLIIDRIKNILIKKQNDLILKNQVQILMQKIIKKQ
jgi:hypothetical protein